MLVFIFICMRFPRKKQNPCNPFCMSSTHLVQHSATVRIILQSKKSKSLVFIYNARSWTKRVLEKQRMKTGIHGRRWKLLLEKEHYSRPHWKGGGFAQQAVPCITNDCCRKIPLTIRLLREVEIHETD
jgi:hypothetical protein